MPSVYARARQSRLVDMVVFAAIVLVILAVLLVLPQPAPLDVSGRARIIDGDSLVVQGTELRLEGVDAPEAMQTCSRSGRDWSCGREAAQALAGLLRSRIVNCSGNRRDVHDRLLATCKVGEEDVNRWLVANGWAVAFGGYVREERAARSARRGIWSGTFIRPQDWREENR